MYSNFRLPLRAVDSFRRTISRIRSFGPQHCLFVLLLLLCMPTQSFSDVPDNNVVPFHLVHGFAVIVPVMVNGHGPYDFMLDTGSTITTLDPELGRELALQTDGHGAVITLAQRLSASLTTAKSIALGPVTEQNLEVLIRDLSGLRRVVPSVRGVLGQNALNHADFLLDYRHKRLEFDADGELVRALSGHHVPMRRERVQGNPEYANLGVPVSLTQNGVHETVFLLDSGAASPVIFTGVDDSSEYPQGAVEDAAGQKRFAGLRNLQFAVDGKLRELPAQALTLKGITPEMGGLLPTCIFSGVYISNTGGFAVFEPKEKRGRQTDRIFAGMSPQSGAHGHKS